MVGAWSDNQPDYSWTVPGEVRIATGHWYPFRLIGGAKAATAKAAVNLEVANGRASFGFHATAVYPQAEVVITARDKEVFKQTVAIAPDRPFVSELALPDGTRESDVEAILRSEGEDLVRYRPVLRSEQPKPSTVQPPPPPQEIKSNEELYLAGLRLEQFHNARKDPLPYYEEALRRDPGDYPSQHATGPALLETRHVRQAEEHLRTATARISKDYTRPKSGEGHYYLGLALQAQGKLDEARKAFQWAAWDHGQAAASYLALARLSSLRGDYRSALDETDHSLHHNSQSLLALGLKGALLRRLGRHAEAIPVIDALRQVDPLDFMARNELVLLARASNDAQSADRHETELRDLMRDEVENYLELAVDYGNAGLWEEAIEVLDRRIRQAADAASSYPMLLYFRAYYSERAGHDEVAQEYYRLAAGAPAEQCFPYRTEELDRAAAGYGSEPERRARPVLPRQPAVRSPEGRGDRCLGEVP